MIMRWPDICTPHILDVGQVMQNICQFPINIVWTSGPKKNNTKNNSMQSRLLFVDEHSTHSP